MMSNVPDRAPPDDDGLPDQALNLWLPGELYRRLRTYKEETGITIKFTVIKALTEYLDRNAGPTKTASGRR